MIDVSAENLIPLRDVPKHTPGRPHIATVYRWVQRADRPLDVVRVGGRLFSSLEAIGRFVDRCTFGDTQTPATIGRARERQIAEAERELTDAGIA